MKIEVVETIHHPFEDIWKAYRDKLPDLAEYLPNIKDIKVLEREDEGEVVKFLNRWQAAKTEVPTVARPFIDPDKLYWLDHATWREADKATDWRMEIPMLGDRVKTSGTNFYFIEGPEKTRFEIRGDFQIDLKSLPGVPGFLAGRVEKAVEKFVINLLIPNFTKLNEALEEYLNDQKK